MDASTTLTISGYAVAGGVYITMRLNLDAARSTALMISKWWMAAEDKLDAIHHNHVKAGKTRHAAYRAHVRAKCAEISTALPPATPERADRDFGLTRSPAGTSVGAGQGIAYTGANDRDVANNLERK